MVSSLFRLPLIGAKKSNPLRMRSSRSTGALKAGQFFFLAIPLLAAGEECFDFHNFCCSYAYKAKRCNASLCVTTSWIVPLYISNWILDCTRQNNVSSFCLDSLGISIVGYYLRMLGYLSGNVKVACFHLLIIIFYFLAKAAILYSTESVCSV